MSEFCKGTALLHSFQRKSLETLLEFSCEFSLNHWRSISRLRFSPSAQQGQDLFFIVVWALSHILVVAKYLLLCIRYISDRACKNPYNDEANYAV